MYIRKQMLPAQFIKLYFALKTLSVRGQALRYFVARSATELAAHLLLGRGSVCLCVCMQYASRGIWPDLTGQIEPGCVTSGTNQRARCWCKPATCSEIGTTDIKMMMEPASWVPPAQIVIDSGGFQAKVPKINHFRMNI